MPKPRTKNKSAMDVLVDSFFRLREEARQRMAAEEFQEAERQFRELADKVRGRARAAEKPPFNSTDLREQ